MDDANEAIEVTGTSELPAPPDEHSFSVLQGRYEELCEAASKQLHDMLRGASPTAR